MNPQSKAESRRILAVVDDLLNDIDILSQLPHLYSAIPAKDMERLHQVFELEGNAEEIEQQLHEHYELERRLDMSGGGGGLGGGGMDSVMATPDDIEDLHFSTRALVDTLRYVGYGSDKADGDSKSNGPNPQHVSPHWSSYTPSYPVSERVSNFNSIMGIMRELLYDHLNTTMEDEVIKITILNDTVHREQSANVDVQALGRDLVQERESRKIEVEKRETQIEKLKNEILAVQESAEEDEDSALRAHAEQYSINGDHFLDQELDKERVVSEAREMLRKKQKDCSSTEAAHRSKRTKKEFEVNAIIRQYDEEMKLNTEAIEEAKAQKEAMERRLDEVKLIVDKLKAEEDQHSREQATDDANVSHTKAIREMSMHHARIIQAFFRSHAARVHQAQKGKKKKRKGKKK